MSRSPAGERDRSERSIAARIFLSPEEHRLRAGWRLLLHSLLTFLFSLPLVLLLILASALFQLINLEQLLEGISPTLALVTVPSVTLATWVARRYIDRRSFRSLGFALDHHTLRDLAVGFAIPGVLFALIFAFDWGMGWMRFDGWRWQSDGWISAITLLMVG